MQESTHVEDLSAPRGQLLWQYAGRRRCLLGSTEPRIGLRVFGGAQHHFLESVHERRRDIRWDGTDCRATLQRDACVHHHRQIGCIELRT